MRAASADSAPHAPVRLGLTGGSATPKQGVGRVGRVRKACRPSSPPGDADVIVPGRQASSASVAARNAAMSSRNVDILRNVDDGH